MTTLIILSVSFLLAAFAIAVYFAVKALPKAPVPAPLPDVGALSPAGKLALELGTAGTPDEKLVEKLPATPLK